MKINNLNVYLGIKKLENGCTIKPLTKYEDFKKMVKVFMDPPFCEKCSEEDMIDEFSVYQSDKGGGFVLFDEKDNPLSSVFFEYSMEEQHKDLLGIDNSDVIGYISGMTTLKEARGHGYNTLVFEHTVDYFKEEGFEYLYLRTNKNGSMSEGIAYKHGFKDVYKDGKLVVQNVEFERCNPNVPSMDERKLLIKKL